MEIFPGISVDAGIRFGKPCLAGTRIDVATVPGAQVQSDDEWLGYLREAGTTIYHPTCTAMMGTGKEAVVDSHLRVVGLNGLRVVDVSIMPAVVSGNTNAAVIAIAEKAADLIRSERGG